MELCDCLPLCIFYRGLCVRHLLLNDDFELEEVVEIEKKLLRLVI